MPSIIVIAVIIIAFFALVARPPPVNLEPFKKDKKGKKGKKGKKDRKGDPTTAPAEASPAPVDASGQLGASLVPSSGTGEWNEGYATYYDSYPACCKNAPNYDPKASKEECSDYSGCKYMGQFASGDKLSLDQVKSRNIIAFFSDKDQKNEKSDQKWWNANVKGKKIELKNLATGKTIVAEALDTCGNYDCGGCCSKNAKKGGGTLIDMEVNTAQRFWGKPQNGKIQWRWVA